MTFEEEFRGVIGTSVTESTPWWPETPSHSNRPNIVVIVLDDTGFADLGCYGSEIRTPNIDRLASDGLRFRNFHTTPLCSPTRAALLTGRNSHNVGMRFLSEVDTGFPNCRGQISATCGTLAQILDTNGYATMAVGKWHLAPLTETSHAGPFHNWPLGRGFQRFYGFMGGVTDHYTPELVRDNTRIRRDFGDDYHLSEDLTDEAVLFVREQTSLAADRPFFLYLAFGATHAPFQVPVHLVEKYDEVFAHGWDRIRLERLQRQIELGIVPQGTELSERPQDIPAWHDLDDRQRRVATRLQATYAAFLEHTDTQIGRLLDALGGCGVLDDTMIVLLSDNGASHEGGSGAMQVLAPYNGLSEELSESERFLEAAGGRTTAPHYPAGWAMASNTPFRRYKQYVDGGGVNTPLLVRYPHRIGDAGAVRTQFVHAIDITPTILDVVGIDPPRSIAGVPQRPMDGRSVAAALDNPDVPAGRRTQAFEMFGHRALVHERWKIVAEHVTGEDYAQDRWRLYDLHTDVSEHHDLAARQPRLVEQLAALWWREAEANGILPLDDRPMRDMLNGGHVAPAYRRTRWTLYPPTYVPFGLAPNLARRAWSCRADLLAGEGDGTVFAQGSALTGHGLGIIDGILVYEYNALGHRTRVSAGIPVPTVPARVEISFRPARERGGSVRLLIDDVTVGEGRIPLTLDNVSFLGLAVGRDSASPVLSGEVLGRLLRLDLRLLEERPT
ncbi:arylsulfatase [Streptosporangium sp. NPDC049644]|uniref:arylsulfatase n=1 Tax=Streptosporangium sp. NPDC049644 TaxID=3155507 RepID=UPI003434B909